MTSSPPSPELLADLSRRVLFQAGIYQDATQTNSSPLYAALSLEIANDPDVLVLMEHADRATQITNLLFAAVHDLLLSGVKHPLSYFYPDLVEHPRPVSEAYPFFREFCLAHAEQIRQLVNTRRVQTNEVRRCACLLPAFGLIAGQNRERPLAMIEIGASAGLNLLWDQFSYDYGPAGRIGAPGAAVQLACTPLGGLHPPLPETLPSVASRIGIDLHPIDLFDEDSVRWLRALIWPEHLDRARRLEAAIALARQTPPRVLAGSAVDLLASVVNSTPTDATLCIYHSFTLTQMAQTVLDALHQQFAEIARKRPFYRVSFEWYNGQEKPCLELFQPGQNSEPGQLLAHCESHGRWIEWQAAV